MGTMKKLGSGSDVVDYLKDQHAQIKELFATTLGAEGARREGAFRELRRMMAVHETAEEEIVHPAARSLPHGVAIVGARLREEKAAKTALLDLERHAIDSETFTQKLRRLEADVLAHARSEERMEFEHLPEILDEVRLQRMRKAVQIAEAMAPTRPHPGMESATANFLAGPFASMLDRARDALGSKP